jgi:hypothetical protein
MKTKLYTLAAFLFVFFILWLGFELWLSTGSSHRKIAEYTGYSRICVDGVEYLQFTSGASVAYDINGKVKVCR